MNLNIFFKSFAYFISMISGAGIGIGMSFIVNCTLVEISKSKYFSFVNQSITIQYFAIFFLIIGVYILLRSLRSYQTTFQNPDYIQVNKKDKLRIQYLILLGVLLIISSMFALSMQTHFIKSLHYLLKIPIFSCLGVAVTFSIGVSVTDLINLAFVLIQPKGARPPINSSKQVQ